MSRREFQFVEGSSQKFWAIELTGSSHTVNFGRFGTAGQTQTKEFDSEGEAKKSYDKLIAEKVKKGYVELKPDEPAPAVKSAAAPGNPERPLPLRHPPCWRSRSRRRRPHRRHPRSLL